MTGRIGHKNYRGGWGRRGKDDRKQKIYIGPVGSEYIQKILVQERRFHRPIKRVYKT
jgi:hypothetical protein